MFVLREDASPSQERRSLFNACNEALPPCLLGSHKMAEHFRVRRERIAFDIDYGPKYVAHDRDILEIGAFAESSFDCVTMNEVLDHLLIPSTRSMRETLLGMRTGGRPPSAPNLPASAVWHTRAGPAVSPDVEAVRAASDMFEAGLSAHR